MLFSSVFRLVYGSLLKPVFFRLDPEWIHERMTGMGITLGSTSITRWITRKAFYYEHPSLSQTLLNIHFSNPIGLAAGFDKNGKLTDILPSVGFGFEEIGSITADPCEGNPKKRLWRLPKSKALVVNYGLANDGAEIICSRLKKKTMRFPIGISMAKTNCRACAADDEGIKDHERSLEIVGSLGDYHVLNISCPNAYGGQPFHEPRALEKLLQALSAKPMQKPRLVKISPDITPEHMREIIGIGERYGIAGYIIGNLTKQIERPCIDQQEWKDASISSGGVSGKPTEELSNRLIEEAYRTTGGKRIIIGCGGVFSAKDAYTKIRKGANLVQLVTGMIYEGPQLIGEINRDLVQLLQKDGYTNITEAVGADIH